MQKEKYANGDCTLEKIDCTDGLTVGELKSILNYLPNELSVVVNGAYPIIYVTNVPHENAVCFEDEDCIEIEDYIAEFDMKDITNNPDQLSLFDDTEKCTDCDFSRDCEMDCQNPQGCCKKPPEPELKPSED